MTMRINFWAANSHDSVFLILGVAFLEPQAALDVVLKAPIACGFPGGSEVKEPACNVGDPGSIPGSRRLPGEGNGNPLQYFCLENPMNGETWQTTVFEGSQRVRHD